MCLVVCAVSEIAVIVGRNNVTPHHVEFRETNLIFDENSEILSSMEIGEFCNVAQVVT